MLMQYRNPSINLLESFYEAMKHMIHMLDINNETADLQNVVEEAFPGLSQYTFIQSSNTFTHIL